MVHVSYFILRLGTCLNNEGYKCMASFWYDGNKYHACTRAGGYDVPWCYDVRGGKEWGYCGGKLISTNLEKNCE